MSNRKRSAEPPPDWLPLAGGAAYPTVPADELRPHQAALRMPPLSDEEFAALVEDVKQHGVHYPILVDDTGLILDGIHRWRACKRLGIEVPVRVLTGLTEVEKLNRALGMNLRRRHLTHDQKVEIARGLRADGHTFARIEEITGWADATVCDWLREKKPEPTLTKPAPPAPTMNQTDLIHQAIMSLCDAREAAWDEDSPPTEDYDRRLRRYQLDLVQGLAGRLQAYADAGREGYWEYDAANPFPADIYSAEYGVPIPGTDKYQRERARRPGPPVGGDGQVPR
jgi:hypothetical protein